MTPARYIMVGGFLGAGKTTAVLRLAEALHRDGRRVGLITNDQSIGLVDTTVLTAHGFPVEEITGGCFCCRFNSLVDAAQRLAAGSGPHVFIAEPVGSPAGRSARRSSTSTASSSRKPASSSSTRSTRSRLSAWRPCATR
jgi:Ni2+-binding GTPase involved in maturation of urease and hydrogenase